MNAAMNTIRRAFPNLRRTEATAIVHSGERKTVFGCLCGERHTTSTDWHGREARHVTEWREAHEECAEAIAAALEDQDLRLRGTVIGFEQDGRFVPFCVCGTRESK